MVLIAAVEGGGTSFKVAICRADDGSIVQRLQVDSSGDDPTACLDACCTFLRQFQPLAALGIATFGPVGVKVDDPTTYGRILSSSPKAAWRNVDVRTPLLAACRGNGEQETPCACLIDTDVNAPAYAEFLAAQQQQTQHPEDPNTTILSSCAYITVGTGVGVGLVVNGQTVHGLMHPEGGHVPVHPLPNDTFGGYSWGRREGSSCPFQGQNTVEGLASSVALAERWQLLQQQLEQHGGLNTTSTTAATTATADRSLLQNIPDNCDELWDHAANALASLCTTLLLVVSVERIVLGGGVMRRPCLLDKIRKRTAELLNGYLDLGAQSRKKKNDNDMSDNNVEALRSIITTSRHGDDAGLVGAIVLAQRAWKESSTQTTMTTTTAVGPEKHDRDQDEHEDDATTMKFKQEAFKAGLVHGFLVGVVATALIMQYGLFGFGRNKKDRR